MNKTQMPVQATCCQCREIRPVKAQMVVGNRTIPLLVVPQDVKNVQDAIAAATCQVCLAHQGRPDRGLYEVLKSLGCVDEPSPAIYSSGRRPIPVVMASPAVRPAPMPVPMVVVPGKSREGTVASLTGVTIRPGPSPARGSQGRGSPRDDRREPVADSRPPHPVKHLKGRLDAVKANSDALKAARAAVKEREELARQAQLERQASEDRARCERFDNLMEQLCALLAQIRELSATQDVDELIVEFNGKLEEAVKVDLMRRDKFAHLAWMGSSVEELVELVYLVYQSMSVERYAVGDRIYSSRLIARVHPTKEERKARIKLERAAVRLDAFEGGRRPMHWDEEGGNKPAFYEFVVLRRQSSLAISNPPLPGGGGGGLHPQIPSLEEATDEPDSTVEDGKGDQELEKLCVGFARTFGDWLVYEVLDQTATVSDLVKGFFVQLKLEELAQANQANALVQSPSADQRTVTISSDRPANT